VSPGLRLARSKPGPDPTQPAEVTRKVYHTGKRVQEEVGITRCQPSFAEKRFFFLRRLFLISLKRSFGRPKYLNQKTNIADITAHLENGNFFEHTQAIAARESPRPTKLYDRTADAITLDEVERIAI
jgi:hypothetical protein